MSRVAYVEGDAAAPLNKYGASKLAGEELIRKTGARHLILRLSWVFGNGNQNFIAKLLDWVKKPGALTIVEDEVSVPTYTEDAVTGSLAALKSGLEGLWHLPNTGLASRYEWAGLVLKTLKMEKQLLPGRLADFKLPARRPGFSAMTNAANRAMRIRSPGVFPGVIARNAGTAASGSTITKSELVAKRR